MQSYRLLRSWCQILLNVINLFNCRIYSFKESEVIKGMENIWRRFKIIGPSENEIKLNRLVEDKKLTRDDLTLILNTISLSEKIKESENVKVYDCGIYADFDAKILRKYTDDRSPVKLPDNYLLIVLEKDL